MKKQMIALCLAILLSVLALAACSAQEEKADEIVFGIAQDLDDDLDPHKMISAGTKEIMFNVFEGLLKPTTEGELAPALVLEGVDLLRHLLAALALEKLEALDDAGIVRRETGECGRAFPRVEDAVAQGHLLGIEVAHSARRFKGKRLGTHGLMLNAECTMHNAE